LFIFHISCTSVCTHIHTYIYDIHYNICIANNYEQWFFLLFIFRPIPRLFSLVNVNAIRARTYFPPLTIKITGMQHENARSVRVIKKKPAYGRKINKLHIISTCEIKIGRRNRKLMKRLRKTTPPTMNSVQAV